MTNVSYQSGFEIEPNIHNETQQDDAINADGKRPPLSTILRIFGACAVVASLSLFLIEGWKDGNDLSRYVKLLAQTGLITGAGMFLAFVIKEVKGARIFFGLGLISAVANFTILGALTYSMIQLDGALGDYPSMLKWEAVSASTFIPLSLGAILLLVLLSRFSFGIFARAEAGKLTVCFLALNALLLIPVREAAYVSMLAAVALLAATKVSTSIIKRKELLLTLEAKYALACLFLPGLIIVARALGLYAIDELVLLTVFAILYYALRNIGLMTSGGAQTGFAWGQYGSGMAAASLSTALIPSQYDELSAAVFSLTALAITFDQAKLNLRHNTELTQTFISLSCMAVLIWNMLNTLFITSVSITILNLCMMIGVLITVQIFANTVAGLRSSQTLAVLSIVVTALTLLFRLVSMFDVGSWVLFGGLGISLILLASLYERFSMVFKLPSSVVKA